MSFTRKVDDQDWVQANDINELQEAIEGNDTRLDILESGVYNVLEYGATGDGTTDDTEAIQDAIDAAGVDGGDIVVPPGSYKVTSTLTLTDGVRLAGIGAPNRWRSLIWPATLVYTGTGSCLEIIAAEDSGRESVTIENLHVDGTTTSGLVDGLLLDASASDSYIEGVLIRNCAFTNFSRYQIHSSGTVFDVTLDHVTLHNKDRAADNCLHLEDTTSQWKLSDCWILPYTDGKWGVHAAELAEITFLGGTVAPMGAGNGILVRGGLSIFGTHVEGVSSASSTTVGIRYVGSTGAYIAPISVAFFGIGVQIGDGTADAARGWVISGAIGNNNVAAGGFDVQITAGGHRYGTIYDLGYANGDPTISDLRASSDGVPNVLYLNKAQAVRANAYTVSNLVTDRTYDANSTTTAELADVLGTLIADLRTLGILA